MDYKELEEAGIDVASLKDRLMGNEAMIERFMKKFRTNETYSALEKAIDNSDWKAAFEASHLLKGMSGNLSMTQLYDLFTQQVALFRAGENEKASALMADISAKYENTIKHINRWLEK